MSPSTLINYCKRAWWYVEQFGKDWPPAPNWKECVRLALPAVIVGTLIRLCFFVVSPETYLGDDSFSYMDAARTFYSEGEIEFEEKRRYLYPLLLLLTVKVPFIAPVYLMTLIQNTLGVLSIIPFVYVARWVLPNSRVMVVIASLVYATWYKNLNYEHEAIADSIFVFLVISFTASAIALSSGKYRKDPFLLFIFAALAVGTRPIGKLLWLAALFFALLFAKNPRKWAKKTWAPAVIGCLFFNSVGDSNQSSWLLLSSTLPLVPTEGRSYSHYHDTLSPYILEARKAGLEYPWIQDGVKKTLARKLPPEEWTTESPEDLTVNWGDPISDALWQDQIRDSDRQKIYKGLARKGMIRRPLHFASFTMTKTLIAFEYNAQTSNLEPGYLAERQLEQSGKLSDTQKVSWELFFRRTPEESREKLERRQEREGIPLLINLVDWIGRSLPFTQVYEPDGTSYPSVRLAWFGWAALIGLVATVWFRLRWAILILLPTCAVVGAAFAVGDKVARYAFSGEWLMIIGGFCGLWWAGLLFYQHVWKPHLLPRINPEWIPNRLRPAFDRARK